MAAAGPTTYRPTVRSSRSKSSVVRGACICQCCLRKCLRPVADCGTGPGLHEHAGVDVIDAAEAAVRAPGEPPAAAAATRAGAAEAAAADDPGGEWMACCCTTPAPSGDGSIRLYSALAVIRFATI